MPGIPRYDRLDWQEDRRTWVLNDVIRPIDSVNPAL